MRITAVETFALETPLERPFGWSQMWTSSRSVGIVKIRTDSGIAGWGEGSGGPAAAVVRDMFAPLLIGQDPTNRQRLWERMYHALHNGNVYGGFGGSAMSAVDIALWDITGKALGLPVHALLGGKLRESVACYATGLYYTEGEFPDRLLDEARGYAAQGFTGMKTKVGGLSMKEDIRRVAAIRQAIGPDVKLMVDANQAYNAYSAIRIGRELAEHDVLWFEEPVSAKDINAYAEVKAALPMAIAGGENLRTRFEFKEFFARRAFDIVQPDIAHCGGLTEMRNIAAMANAFGVQVNPHVWGSPIMIAATAHLLATLPPCPHSGSPEPYFQEPVMEFDRTPNAIREQLSPVPFEQRDGRIEVPSGPGLGVEIDEDALRRFATE